MSVDHDVASRTGRALRRADLARASGCNLETIRYYESIGILPLPVRTATGHRVYGGADVRRLRFILRARDLGFSLDSVRGLLALSDGAHCNCAEVKEKTEAHLAEVRVRIEDLRRIEAVLSETASRCSGTDAPACPILDVLGGAPVHLG